MVKLTRVGGCMFNGSVALQEFVRFLGGDLPRNQAGRDARPRCGQLAGEVEARQFAAHFGLPECGLAQSVGKPVG
ncbi:MAG: hypothetical protein ACPIA5_06300, partial [Flavobacteriales bacterium]